MPARLPGLRNGAAVGLFATLTALVIAAPPAFCEESDSGAGALPEVVRTQGLVAYRTNNTLLPVFVKRLAETAGLDLRGVELLQHTQLSSQQGVESVPALIARVLEDYNYVLAFTADEGARSGPAGTLIIAGRKGLSEQQDPAQQSAESPEAGMPEASEGRVRSETSLFAEPKAAAGQESTLSGLPKSEPARVQGKAQPTQPTVGSMLEDHLATFRMESGQGSGIGQLTAPAGIAQPAGNAASAPATAQAGVSGNPVDLQEATRRALESVQEMARALEAASSQLSQQKK